MVAPGGTSFSTTALAPMRASRPTVIGAQHLSACADHDAVTQGRMPLARRPGNAAEGHLVIERHVVADHRGLADDNAHAVVDEEAPADLRAGVDLDARDDAAHVGDEAPPAA